jgi:hypothetical protein
MPESPLPIAATNTVCAACGAAFHCGFRAGENHCWCADLPKLMPMPDEGTSACLCEACLRAEIAKRISLNQSPGGNASHA